MADDVTRASGPTWLLGRCRLDVRLNLSRRNRLSGGVEDLPCLKVFKSCQDKDNRLTWSGRVEEMTSRCPF